MKKCPTCNRSYSDDTLRFCLEDGSSLSAAYDPQTTQRMPARHGGDSQSTEILLHPEKAAETVESRAYPTTPSPPSPAFVGQVGPTRRDQARGWPWLLLSVPILLVLLIVVLGGGIWLLRTITKGGAEKRWLAMLARGQVNAPTVVRETTAELVNNPRNALALRARSGAYYVSSESDQGKRDAEEVERLLASAASAEEYEARCYARWRLGKPDLAVSDCTRAIELDRRFVWPYHNRANAYNDKRDYVNAIADWNKAIEIDSKFAPAYNNRGVYYTNNTRDYDRALSDLSKAIEIDPQYAAAYSARGNAYVYKGDYDHAIADYNKTMDLDPSDARAYDYRGHVYFYKQDYNQAITDYNKAIELNPQLAWAYNGRGLSYYYKGNLDQAVVDYNKAIELDPQDAAAFYNNRANVYYFRKDYGRAIADYSKAIEVNPRYALAYSNRANVYQAIGDRASAAV